MQATGACRLPPTFAETKSTADSQRLSAPCAADARRAARLRLRACWRVRQADAAHLGDAGQYGADQVRGQRAEGHSAGAVRSDRARRASAAHGADRRCESAVDFVSAKV